VPAAPCQYLCVVEPCHAHARATSASAFPQMLTLHVLCNCSQDPDTRFCIQCVLRGANQRASRSTSRHHTTWPNGCGTAINANGYTDECTRVDTRVPYAICEDTSVSNQVPCGMSTWAPGATSSHVPTVQREVSDIPKSAAQYGALSLPPPSFGRERTTEDAAEDFELFGYSPTPTGRAQQKMPKERSTWIDGENAHPQQAPSKYNHGKRPMHVQEDCSPTSSSFVLHKQERYQRGAPSTDFDRYPGGGEPVWLVPETQDGSCSPDDSCGVAASQHAAAAVVDGLCVQLDPILDVDGSAMQQAEDSLRHCRHAGDERILQHGASGRVYIPETQMDV
jgi:hypothetical protein